MDKSSRIDISLDEQRRAWNDWNLKHRSGHIGEAPERQAAVILAWCDALKRDNLRILEAGCGTGWLSYRLLQFGEVLGVDLADEAIDHARRHFPGVEFARFDLQEIELPPGSYDVIVALEVLPHVADKAALLARIARFLKPGGHLMIAAQNRWVMERWEGVGGPNPGQIRCWTSPRELRQLLRADFEILELTSILPVGHEGLLRLINSTKLSRILGAIFSPRTVERAKERALLGRSLLVHARRRLPRAGR